MSKIVTIKLTRATATAGPFNIYDQFENIIAQNVPKRTLIQGVSYTVGSNVDTIILESIGVCEFRKSFSLTEFNTFQFTASNYVQAKTACLWRHLTNIQLYNSFYGNTEPYIIEYPQTTLPNTEILQNIQDYSKVYRYFPNDSFDQNRKIELDDKYFNKMVIYNDQQSSGVLELVSKPLNNLSSYLNYPLYNTDSKTILYTKSDNFYKVNTFWDITKDKTVPLFISSCQSQSIDKEVNQDNMIYTNRSFKKYPLRAKDVKIRYILDNDDSIHIVSQFITTTNQISYK